MHREVLSLCTVEVYLEGFWALSCWHLKWMQLYSNLNILWHCLSLGLERKLTFSSLMATAELSKFVAIMSAALSEHHLLRFEIVSWNSITSTTFVCCNVSYGPLQFIFQDFWLVCDHTIVVLWVIKTFFVLFLCVLLPPLVNIF